MALVKPTPMQGLPMNRKYVRPNEPIGLPLTAEQRRMLLTDCFIPNPLYLARLQRTPAERRETFFTLRELDDLLDYVAAEANRCKRKPKRQALDAIYRTIQHLLATHTDQHDPKRTTDLTGIELFSVDSAGLDAFQQLLSQCESMGMDIDVVLQSMQPTKVAPNETLAVRMTPAQRNAALHLASLTDEIKAIIAAAPARKRTVDLTLRQVTELENLVAIALEGCNDRKLGAAWRKLDATLIDLETHYTDGTEPHNAFQKLLSGHPVSRGAAVREVLMKVAEARKGDQGKPGQQPIPDRSL